MITEDMKILEDPRVLATQATGSAFVCDPPVTDTDIDILVLLTPDAAADDFLGDLEKAGWVLGGSSVEALAEAGDEFQSYRKGKLNLILTARPQYFARLKLATLMAKQFNLTKKRDRIALFEVVADQNECPDVDGIDFFAGDL